jgi:hypothetical protein
MEYITDEVFRCIMSVALACADFVAWVIDLVHEEK